jgi:hypothetical protein
VGPALDSDSLLDSSKADQPRDMASVAPEQVAGPEPAAAKPAGPNEYYAGLVEDRTDKPQLPKIQVGSVSWISPSDASAAGAASKNNPVPVAQVNIASADLKIQISVCCWRDEAAPATELSVQLQVEKQPAQDPIREVTGLKVRQTGNADGEPLVVKSFSESPNAFRLSLSSDQSEVGRNSRLLLSRPWIDIPVTYVSGRKAILTFAMGQVGAETMDRALHLWHGP